MARSSKPKSLPLKKVRAGEGFAMPLPDGRWGACRVRCMDDDPLSAVVAASSWIGAAPPELTEPKLLDILRTTHHGSARESCECWVQDRVPPEFVYVGNLPPTAKEAKLGCGTFSDWHHAPQELFWHVLGPRVRRRPG